MANKVEIDIIGKDLASAALDAVRSKLIGLGTSAGAVAAGVITVGAAVVTGLNKAKNVAQAYDQQVYQLMLNTGGTAEATSRLVQTVDDAGISYETLTTAMKYAVKNGVEPNIKGLADLSDQYKKLKPGVEQGQFLLQKFGRSGLDMARFMDLGSASIQRMSQNTEVGLILNSKAIQQSEEYRINMDNLKDSWDGFVVTTGNQVIPVLNSAISYQNRYADALEAVKNKYGELTPGVRNWRVQEEMNRQQSIAVADATAAHGDALDGIVNSAHEASSALQQVSTDFANVLNMAKNVDGASTQMLENMAYQSLIAKLSVDGLTESEYQIGIAAGVSMNQYSAAAGEASLKIDRLNQMVVDGTLDVRLLAGAIAAIKSKDVEINVAINISRMESIQKAQTTSRVAADAAKQDGRTYSGYAEGGITTGPQSGHWELLHGTEGVFTEDQMRYLAKGGMSPKGGDLPPVTVIYSPTFSTANQSEFEQAITPMLNNWYRRRLQS